MQMSPAPTLPQESTPELQHKQSPTSRSEPWKTNCTNAIPLSGPNLDVNPLENETTAEREPVASLLDSMLDSLLQSSTSSKGVGQDGNLLRLRGGGSDTDEIKASPPMVVGRKLDEDMSDEIQIGQDDKKRPEEGSISQGPRELIDSQSMLNQYREQLARDMQNRESGSRNPHPAILERKRVSPIREERSTSPTSTPETGPGFEMLTASTESNRTVRGGSTPSLTPGQAATMTPSYPFPRMATPRFTPSALHRVFNSQAQTSSLKGGSNQSEGPGFQDQVRSDPSTPASAMTFQPTGAPPIIEDPQYPTPNLYDLTLMLTAEPGLDAWWGAVVQIMKQYYKAERVTLSVPADATDLENVPWGQKATYNVLEDDELSMGYMAKGSSRMPSSIGDHSERRMTREASPKGNERLVRPRFQSRHSFTSYEDKKTSRTPRTPEHLDKAKRPGALSRSKSYFTPAEPATPHTPHPALNKQALDEHNAAEEQLPIPSWEATTTARPKETGRVLPVLQGLDMEADPLIDQAGVKRVIERGKVIALTRTYPYLQAAAENKSHGPEESRKKQTTSISTDTGGKLSSLLGNASLPKPSSHRRGRLSFDNSKIANLISVSDEAKPRPSTPKYEEYEQAPPSPWSQSPAPSPAVRADPQENPFFTDATVDEESFNPGPSPQDYSGVQPPETIGVDNSWTVLHIPLKHILLSKTAQTFKLDPAALEQKSASRNKWGSTKDPATATEAALSAEARQNHQSTIAILSILSPVIPYPSSLRYSLGYLGPQLATSFSLCRHYSNLETEVAGLGRKRPPTAGFGGLGPDGRPLIDPMLLSQLDYAPSETFSQRSMAGSLTSPSDYSAPSRSAAASPMGTPSWDPSPFGLVVERRTTGTSPGQAGGDSYFATRPTSDEGTNERTLAPAGYNPTKAAQDTPPSAGPRHRRSGSWKRFRQDINTAAESLDSPSPVGAAAPPDDMPSPSENRSQVVPRGASDQHDTVVQAEGQKDPPEIRKRSAMHSTSGQGSHRHTHLHSYGADFATTLQSLPFGTSLKSASYPASQVHTSPAATMLPPSDRLKSLMLDSLPAHVFVALPVTGEVVWVNSRYLSYRGQAIADLVKDPWRSVHPEDREAYIQKWTHSLRTGEQFAETVRLRRFDGVYRWHQARAVASRDKRGVIIHIIGSYMDIHDQKIAELRAARQEEIEASEAKHRLLANLIPQIIFTATEDEGITFANHQWLSYTGQSFEDARGLGFMDFVHPDDLAKCGIPTLRAFAKASAISALTASETSTAVATTKKVSFPTDTSKGPAQPELPSGSSGNAIPDPSAADLSELAKKGIIKVATDSTGRVSYTTELRLRSKTGEYRWHLIRCVEIDNIDFGTGASSYFGSATDINEHKLLEAKLKEAMESKSRFLSNMSHEIRTPLIGISGMVSFLQDTTLNEEQRDYTNTIQTSSNSLLMIINDILDLSKVDAGMMKLNYEWFHARSLIEDVNELVSTMAIAKRLELNYVVEEDVPSWVKGDKVRIRQVLLNVIGNAIKFTTEGEVFSHCRVLKQDEEGQIMLEFSVADTGSGFTKEEAELIFKPFSQIDGSSTRQHGGSGLGLVISRQLVELHGGQMTGDAVPGKGSTFTFSARFGLPTSTDHPITMTTPPLEASRQASSDDRSTLTMQPLLARKVADQAVFASPESDVGVASPALASSGSSDPSVRSGRTQNTTRSSVSSVNVGLVHFSEAAKASGQDLSQMKLEMPSEKSPRASPIPDGSDTAGGLDQFRPPIYSILIICPQMHSREATTKHIQMTLPKNVPHQITTLTNTGEARKMISGDESVTFTHIVINLPSAEEIISMIDQITLSSGGKTLVLILTDSVQRQAVLKLASPEQQQLLNENKIIFVYKPVKPSRFAAVFDPAKSRDLSTDLNRSSAAQVVESQKQSYLDVEKRIGNKGYKVLLVEDNPVNQKVLIRYLKKVGLVAEIAADGVECTDMVYSHPHEYYALILCDLHMPRKDGYEACRDIRRWEKENKHPHKLPIIALSANVMSDVEQKCKEAGFDDYVTKPVDFIDLSNAMSRFF